MLSRRPFVVTTCTVLCLLAVVGTVMAVPRVAGEGLLRQFVHRTPTPASTATPRPSATAVRIYRQAQARPTPARTAPPTTVTFTPTPLPPTATPTLTAQPLPQPTRPRRTVRNQAPQQPTIDLSLHGSGTQLYTAWNSRVTLKAINWYGFEYAPFVPDGLDRAPLDSILFNVGRLGFNTIRLTFADQTVRSNPVVVQGLNANPELRGLHALDIMGRIIARAHAFGLRVVLCDSRSAAGRGPETASGLWYTPAYPEAVWQADWEEVVSRFRHDSAFVGADLRNEPHETGSGTVAERTYLNDGPLWGPYHGTQYWHRDWRLAAERMGNDLLRIDPSLLIIVEGVQVYVDPSGKKVSGGLWGSNLSGVQYAPIRLIRPGRLVYSVHEYGPQMWQGDWFNTKTTYASLSRRWTRLWGYLLGASRSLQAPIFVGEFGTCHEYWSCIASTDGWKQGFWFTSFVRYLHEHPQVGWAYWSLNPTGPFHGWAPNFYSLVSMDWRHYYPLVIHGLEPLLSEPSGMRPQRLSGGTSTFTAMPGCSFSRSCTFASPLPAHAAPLVPFTVRRDVSYVQWTDPLRSGDLYLPQTKGTAARPAVVVVHGGTWDNGQKGTPGTAVLAQALAQHGFVVFDINYRLVGQNGEYPKNIRDVEDAAAYLTVHQKDLQVDPGKIAVTGVSSGGYLALMAGYRQGVAPYIAPHYPGVQVHIRAVGAFFAPVELKSSIRSAGDRPWVQNLITYMGGTYEEEQDRYTMASPLRYADTGVPTIFWFSAADPITPAPQMFELYKRLRQRQVQSQLLDLPGMPRHLTDLSPQSRATAFAQLLGFLDDVLSRPLAGSR